MKTFQHFAALIVIGIGAISGCRLTGLAEEEEKLSQDLCLSASAIYLDRKASRDPSEYNDTSDIGLLIYFCIIRPEYIDSRY